MFGLAEIKAMNRPANSRKIRRLARLTNRVEGGHPKDAEKGRKLTPKPRRKRCSNCEGLSATTTSRPDPYQEDLYGDSTPRLLCDACVMKRADEV